MINLRIATAVATLLFATNITYAKPAPTTNKTETQSKGSFSFTTNFSNASVVGSGSHRYRMILLDPMTNQPLANQDYALSHSTADLPFVKESKKVYQGTTDAQGRTAVFAFKQAVPQSGWNLRPRTGSGPLGEQMVVVINGHIEKGFDYVLVVCEANDPYIYRGVTDISGQTAYVASQTPVDIELYIAGDEPKGENICE